MPHRIVGHLRANVVAYLALAVAIGGGGGYAIAATATKTITVCANKKTGVLYLHQHGRCSRRQTKVSWNQRGPTGRQGAPGPAGAPAISVWGVVAGNGTVTSGRGLSVQHVAAGTYQVTVTAAGCAQGTNAPTVTVSDANPPNGESAGAFPEAWVGDTGTNESFTVNTGVVAGGSFTATDHTFNVQDACS
jgi:hypothetical protein